MMHEKLQRIAQVMGIINYEWHFFSSPKKELIAFFAV
jgi:hypothetical protein